MFMVIYVNTLDDCGGEIDVAFCQAYGKVFTKQIMRQKYYGILECQSVQNKSRNYSYRKKSESHNNVKWKYSGLIAVWRLTHIVIFIVYPPISSKKQYFRHNSCFCDIRLLYYCYATTKEADSRNFCRNNQIYPPKKLVESKRFCSNDRCFFFYS